MPEVVPTWWYLTTEGIESFMKQQEAPAVTQEPKPEESFWTKVQEAHLLSPPQLAEQSSTVLATAFGVLHRSPAPPLVHEAVWEHSALLVADILAIVSPYLLRRTR